MFINTVFVVLTVVVLVLIESLVSDLDFEAAKEDEAQYCEMVRRGFWPDYRDTYLRDCPHGGMPARLIPEPK